MNDNHSNFELKYKTRWIAPLLRDALKTHPIIVLTGARQVGKSTLVAAEVKLSTKPKFTDIENLRLFLEEYPETSACLLIYAGDEVKIMHEKIVAVPWFLLGGR